MQRFQKVSYEIPSSMPEFVDLGHTEPVPEDEGTKHRKDVGNVASNCEQVMAAFPDEVIRDTAWVPHFVYKFKDKIQEIGPFLLRDRGRDTATDLFDQFKNYVPFWIKATTRLKRNQL